jgi:hypothetical protein
MIPTPASGRLLLGVQYLSLYPYMAAGQPLVRTVSAAQMISRAQFAQMSPCARALKTTEAQNWTEMVAMRHKIGHNQCRSA